MDIIAKLKGPVHMPTIVSSFINFWGDWWRVFKLIFLRTIEPLGSVRFILYFFVIVVGIGGVGFWINLLKEASKVNFYYSVATFALTLAAASFADVTLNKNNSESANYKEKVPELLVFPYTCFFMIISASALFGLILCGFDTGQSKYLTKETGILCSQASLLLSLFFWWQVNSTNPQLSKDPTDPNNPLGSADQIDEYATNGYKTN